MKKRKYDINHLYEWFYIISDKVLYRLKKTKIPRTHGASLYDLIDQFAAQMVHSSISINASAMAFNFFLAIFPGLIFIFSLIPYIPIDNLERQIDLWITKVLPSVSAQLISSVLKALFMGKGIGLASIAFLVVIYNSARGLNTLIEAFRKMDPKFTPQLAILPQYGRSLLLLLVLFIMAVIGIGMNITATIVLNDLFNLFDPIRGFERWAFYFLDILVEFLAFFIAISVVYSAAKANSIRMGFISVGSIVATLLMIPAIDLLKWLFSSFFNYNKFYGPLAAVVGLMVWLYWVSIILLLGYNLNVAIRNIAHNQFEKKRKESNMATAI